MTILGKFALAVPLALTVALLILGGSGAATAARSSQVDELGVGPAHWYKPGAYGSWGDGSEQSGATVLQSRLHTFAVDNLANPGNGEIMPSTRTHLIFWLPAGFHYSSSVSDANYENQMIKYFQDIGGSQILNTATQYTGNNGTVTNSSTFVDSIVDTNAFPHTGADVAHAVTQGDLNSEIFTQIGAHAGWNKGMSEMYFIFLPNNLVDCNNALTSCNTNRYCAYHTYGFSGSDTPANDFVWADIPDNRSIYTSGGCGNSNVTGDTSADTTLSSVEHEHLEAVTDPRLNAWQDSTGGGGENGDKCNRNMGVANSSPSIANNFLGGGAADAFRIQREWSNAVSGCAASYTTTGSGVESPAPSGSDVTEAVTEATIAGNNGDTLHYSTSFRNPSNQDDAFAITITDTLPSGVSGSSSFSLGDLAPHRTATNSFTDTVSGGPLLDGTVLTNSAKFDFKDSTTTAQPSITRSATTTVSNAPPSLVLPGPQSQDFHDGLTFGMSATDANAGDTVSLSASGLPAGLSFTDNGDRTGTVSGTSITAAPGPYVVTFTANDHHHLTTVTQDLLVTVLREETTTTYTGVTGAVLDGSTVTLSGVLNEDGTTPISAETLTMTLGSGATAQTCFGTTDAAGSASCDILVNQSVGPKPVSASFAGDAFYLGSSDAGSVVIYTAKSLKQDGLAQATSLVAGANKRDTENLANILMKLNDALTPSLWVDGNHVDAQHGGKVFDREKEVVSKLESIIKDKKSAIPDATLQGMIDSLVHADRILAEDALADAIAATGDPHRIAEAQQELTRAADELAAGDFDGAIEHYKSCWKKSQDAV